MLFYAHLQLLIPVSQSDAHKPSRQLLCQGFGKDAQSSTCLCPRSALPSAALTPELVSSTADTRVAHSLGEEGQDFSPTPLAARSLYMVGRGARNSLLWIGVFVLNRGDGGFTNYTHTHTQTHTRARARKLALPSRLTAGSSGLQLPLPSWSTSSPYSLSPWLPRPSPLLPPPLALLALAAPGSAGRLSFFLSLSPSPRLIDDHRRPMALTPRHPR